MFKLKNTIIRKVSQNQFKLIQLTTKQASNMEVYHSNNQKQLVNRPFY